MLAFPAERLMAPRTLLVLLAVLVIWSSQAAVDGRRKLRENVGRVSSLTGHRWSKWHTALVPKVKGRYLKNYKPRVNSFINSKIKKSFARYDNGIYEIGVSKPGRKRHVVYVGAAHRDGPGSLNKRIAEHFRGDSHKDALINKALKQGYELSVRAQNIPGSRRHVLHSEKQYLTKYDYAWNQRNNGRIRGNVPSP